MTVPRALTALAAAAALAAAPALARTDRPAAAKITAAGVDGVKLGASYTSLRNAGKLAKATKGCEPAGPNTRSARLKAPLKGSVDLTLTRPRKVMTILITGGAKANGVGIGATFAKIKAAFPGTKLTRLDRPGVRDLGCASEEERRRPDLVRGLDEDPQGHADRGT